MSVQVLFARLLHIFLWQAVVGSKGKRRTGCLGVSFSFSEGLEKRTSNKLERLGNAGVLFVGHVCGVGFRTARG